MKILVTGATGFIGAAVARKLSQQGHEVVALSRSDAAAAKLRAAGLTPIAGDFANPASLAAPAAQVDAVVSTASIGQVEGTPESFAKDRDAVEVMTKALGDSGKPLIFTSGSAIFGVFTKGEASPTIFDEEHPVPLPASVFAPPEAEIPPPFIAAFGGAMAPRAETETAVLRAAGIRGIAIRPGLVYGEGRGYDLPNAEFPGRNSAPTSRRSRGRPKVHAQQGVPPRHGTKARSANKNPRPGELNCRHLKRPQTQESRRSIRPAYQSVTTKLQHFPPQDLLQIGARSTPRAAYATV
jgi:nucleoside-diphosphate-sugar epimerase